MDALPEGSGPAALPIADPPFDVRTPSAGRTGPLVFASPHSGRCYPDDLRAASRLKELQLRRSEDAYVDELISAAPDYGVPLIRARYARAYVDLNRSAEELDPTMFVDELPGMPTIRTARVAAGLGAIARVVAEGQEIYARKLTSTDAEIRLEGVYRPYHAALADLINRARTAHGVAILLDWHSMPSAAARAAPGPGGCDIVLGDRYGAACDGLLTRRVEHWLQGFGYRVARNAPYAGGYTTEHYGAPRQGVHALQIELNRALYMDEATLTPGDGLHDLRGNLSRLTEQLAQADWSDLRHAEKV